MFPVKMFQIAQWTVTFSLDFRLKSTNYSVFMAALSQHLPSEVVTAVAGEGSSSKTTSEGAYAGFYVYIVIFLHELEVHNADNCGNFLFQCIQELLRCFRLCLKL